MHFMTHEFDYDHSRASLGGEVRSSFLELNYNQYFSQSDSRTGKGGVAEEVLDGYDLELGSPSTLHSICNNLCKNFWV